MGTKISLSISHRPFVRGAAHSAVALPAAREGEHAARLPADAEPPLSATTEASKPRGAAHDAVRRRLLAVADVLAAVGALLFSILTEQRDGFRLGTLGAVPLIVLIGKIAGLYDREELLVRKSTLEEAPRLFQLATLFALIIWLIQGSITSAPGSAALIALWLPLFLMLLFCRAASRLVSRLLTAPERCLVVGDEATADWMKQRLTARSALNAEVVGRVAYAQCSLDESAAPVPVLDDLPVVVSSLEVQRLIVAPHGEDAEDIRDVIHSARSLGVKVSVLPRVLEIVGSSGEFDEVDGLPLLSLRRISLSRSSAIVKRAFDVAGSMLALIILSPLIVLVAVAIKLDSPGPVLFRQPRVGRGGRPFDMLKFRTMVRDADQQKDALRHLNEADGLFKIAADPRITRVGKLLRMTSLDELPQLLNVLQGEMSLVGPRPLVMDEDSRIVGWRRRRLHLTPGMTGHWQILGSARIPLDEMSRIDYLYVTNWSLWLDIKILLRTIPYVLARRGM